MAKPVSGKGKSRKPSPKPTKPPKKAAATRPAKASAPSKKRSRKPAPAAETVENTVEVNKVLDLQPIEIDERDFKLHYNSIKSATDKMETAKSLLQTCKKRAKEASPDILDAVVKAMRFERMDQDEVARELQIAGYALKQTDNPIQITLFNTLLGDEMKTAYMRGYKDGKAPKAAASNYPEGTDLHNEYMRGWTVGSAENLGVSAADANKVVGESTLYNSDPPHEVDDLDGQDGED